MSLGLHQSDEGSRVVALADGRVLFLAANRAYYLKDLAHGRQLENRLKWTLHLSTLGIIVALMAANWAGNWWLGLLALPAVLLAVLAELFMGIGLTEATDPAARAEVTAHSTRTTTSLAGNLVWPAVALLAMLVPAYLRGKPQSPKQLVEIAIFTFVLVTAAVHIWRQRRLRREDEIIGVAGRTVDNIPIEPQ